MVCDVVDEALACFAIVDVDRLLDYIMEAVLT